MFEPAKSKNKVRYLIDFLSLKYLIGVVDTYDTSNNC